MRLYRVTVEVAPDRMGNLLVQAKVKANEAREPIFLQQGFPAWYDFRHQMPKRVLRDLDRGYNVTFLMSRDEWEGWVDWAADR